MRKLAFILTFWSAIVSVGVLSSRAQPAESADTPAVPGADPAATAGVVLIGRIDGDITLSESAYVKRLIEAAEERGSIALVLEINTFGGRVDAAVAIRDALLEVEIPTVAYINKRAISAGALISLACEKIAISPGGTIGAATPITTSPGQELPAPVEEKYLSYFRQEMRVTAETRGRNGDIAEAMVDADYEIPEISEQGKLLTLTTRTALEHGIADIEAKTLELALVGLGIEGPHEELERTWSEDLVAFLTSSAIVGLLSAGMFMLAYLEYQTPGFGAFGIGAISCFLLLYFGHYLVNLAGWEELMLFALGVFLLVLEMFVFPGFGVAGIAGLLAMIGSVTLLLMAGDWSDVRLTNPFSLDALVLVLWAAAAAVLGMFVLMRLLPDSADSVLGGKMVLAGGLTSDAGYLSHALPETTESQTTAGIALTPLRPSGRGRFGDRRIQVETEGEFINSGDAIRILRREPGRIIVRRA